MARAERTDLFSNRCRDWNSIFVISDERCPQVSETPFSELRLTLGFAHPLKGFEELTNSALPASPYEDDPGRWPELPWYDRRSGKPINVISIEEDRDPELFAQALYSGAVPIATLGTVLTRYGQRPENKSLTSNEAPTTGASVGELRRRPVTSAPELTSLIGKEGHRLAERLSGELADRSQYQTGYGERADAWSNLYLPVLLEIGTAALIEQTGFSRSSIFEVLAGRALAHPDRARKYMSIAANHAANRLEDWCVSLPSDRRAVLWQYLRERERRGEERRLCLWCGGPLPNDARADAHYCSARCWQAASRAMRSSRGSTQPLEG
jgi:hypothetical protein